MTAFTRHGARSRTGLTTWPGIYSPAARPVASRGPRRATTTQPRVVGGRASETLAAILAALTLLLILGIAGWIEGAQ